MVKQNIRLRHQQNVNTEKGKDLPEGINLTECNLSEEQRDKLKEFLSRWNHIFSKGVTDLRKCDLVKHQIKLNDNEPFKEPHRRIPPALFKEVREHLAEMLQAGAIRPSQSSYSSNVVIVRRKTGASAFVLTSAGSTVKPSRAPMLYHEWRIRFIC